MQIKKISCIFFFIMLFCCACRNNNRQTPESALFGGSVILLDSPSKIQIEDFIMDYDTIRLETTDNSMLDGISIMRIMNNKFYIVDKKRTTVYIYSQDGKFINKIEDRGQGPKEYINIKSFEVDYLNNRIILSDSFSNKIFIYDENGTQLQVIKLEFNPSTILASNEGFFSFHSGVNKLYNIPNMENYNLHRLDHLGNFISSAILNETEQRIDIASVLNVCNKPDGTLLYQPVLGNTVYQVTKQGVEAIYTFNFSTYKQLNKKQKKDMTYVFGKSNDLKEKEDEGYLLSWGEIIDLDDYFFSVFRGWNNTVYVYYSKQKKKSVTVIPEQMQGNKILKNIFMTCPLAACGNKFYISPYLFQLMETKNDLPEGKLKTFINNTSYDSNPILISFSINLKDCF